MNGALLARRPDHYKNFTVVGIILMALLGGLGGGITRDVLVGEVPSALTNPAYITLALAFGIVGYLLAYTGGQMFREGLFQFMTSFSLPWYAIVGAQKGVTVGLPVLGCLLLAVVGPTAGRWYIDVSSGVPPKQFIRGEWFVAIAALTGLVWILVTWAGAGPWWAAGISFVVGFTVRVIALYRGWEAAAREGAERRLSALRRPAAAGPQARRQVAARAPRPGPDRGQRPRGPEHDRELRKGGSDRVLRAHKATRGRGGAPNTSVQGGDTERHSSRPSALGTPLKGASYGEHI